MKNILLVSKWAEMVANLAAMIYRCSPHIINVKTRFEPNRFTVDMREMESLVLLTYENFRRFEIHKKTSNLLNFVRITA